jgi:hypothetical protein
LIATVIDDEASTIQIGEIASGIPAIHRGDQSSATATRIRRSVRTDGGSSLARPTDDCGQHPRTLEGPNPKDVACTDRDNTP